MSMGENMVKMISADQMLHGYANGHQLLAASCELHIDDRNRIDELSDLNGHCEPQEFVSYFTGYPIESNQRYVLAKTWYAYEMRRPGCVWTHSLIFNIEDICRISDINRLMELFLRPTEILSYDEYKNKIIIQTEEEKQLPQYNTNKLQYIIYTVFSSENPEYIIVEEKEGQFDNELFIVLNSMPPEILRTFTFCTMSYDIRKYGEYEFKYQMSSEKNIYRFHKKPCNHIMLIKKYPYWVTCYMEDLEKKRLDKLQYFIRQYGKENMTLIAYNQFCRLYFATLNKKDISLREYFDFVDVIMPLKYDVYQTTVERVLDNDFSLDVFQNQEYQILEKLDMNKFKLKKEYKEILSKRIIENTPEKLYPILQNYINGKLETKVKTQLEDIIKKLEPRHLSMVSHMDENICVVLIHMNHKLLLCKDLWYQSRDFQRAVLYAGDRKLQPGLKESVLATIVKYGTENIANDIYEFYGDDIFPIIYGLMEKGAKIEEKKFQNWIPILLQNQKVVFAYINVIPFRQYRLDLFLNVDLTKIDVNDINKEIWEKIYVDFIELEQNEDIRTKCILQLISVIFGSSYQFSDLMVKAVVGPIYQKAKGNDLDFDTWNRFQNFLPEVEDCFAWDKCLRIRRGLLRKGYNVNLVN